MTPTGRRSQLRAREVQVLTLTHMEVAFHTSLPHGLWTRPVAGTLHTKRTTATLGPGAFCCPHTESPFILLPLGRPQPLGRGKRGVGLLPFGPIHLDMNSSATTSGKIHPTTALSSRPGLERCLLEPWLCQMPAWVHLSPISTSSRMKWAPLPPTWQVTLGEGALESMRSALV